MDKEMLAELLSTYSEADVDIEKQYSMLKKLSKREDLSLKIDSLHYKTFAEMCLDIGKWIAFERILTELENEPKIMRVVNKNNWALNDWLMRAIDDDCHLTMSNIIKCKCCLENGGENCDECEFDEDVKEMAIKGIEETKK